MANVCYNHRQLNVDTSITECQFDRAENQWSGYCKYGAVIQTRCVVSEANCTACAGCWNDPTCGYVPPAPPSLPNYAASTTAAIAQTGVRVLTSFLSDLPAVIIVVVCIIISLFGSRWLVSLIRRKP